MKIKIFRQLLYFAFFFPLTVKAGLLSSISNILLASALFLNMGTSKTYIQDRAELKSDVEDYNIANELPSNEGVTFARSISTWSTSKVEDMAYMFSNADSINQSLGKRDPKKKRLSDCDDPMSMECMFRSATSFNQDLSSLDVSTVTNMQEMLNGATSFNQDQDLSKWDPKKMDIKTVSTPPYTFLYAKETLCVSTSVLFVISGITFCVIAQRKGKPSFSIIKRKISQSFQFQEKFDLRLHLSCPISHDLMTEAVVTPGGRSYQKKFIEQWLETNNTDPIDRSELEVEDLHPNYQLRKLVAAYIKAYGKDDQI